MCGGETWGSCQTQAASKLFHFSQLPFFIFSFWFLTIKVYLTKMNPHIPSARDTTNYTANVWVNIRTGGELSGRALS